MALALQLRQRDAIQDARVMACGDTAKAFVEQLLAIKPGLQVFGEPHRDVGFAGLKLAARFVAYVGNFHPDIRRKLQHARQQARQQGHLPDVGHADAETAADLGGPEFPGRDETLVEKLQRMADGGYQLLCTRCGAEPVRRSHEQGVTVVLAQLTPAQVEAYRGMPSWIDESGDPADHFYFLPPVIYPDGHSYLKIGGDPEEVEIDDEAAVRDWFRGEGRPEAIVHLKRLLFQSVPDLDPVRVFSVPCVTAYTEHGYPYAGFVGSERIALLTGGNGAAAKSSDEIGRIGADLVIRGRLDEPDYSTDFAVRLR